MPEIEQEYVKTAAAVLQWQDPIVKITIAKNVYMDVSAVEEIIEGMETLSNDRVYGTLVINQTLKSSSKEARDASANYNPQNLAATAIINTNSIALLMINFYLKVSRPTIPNRIFKNEKDAVQWLLEMIEKHKDKMQ